MALQQIFQAGRTLGDSLSVMRSAERNTLNYVESRSRRRIIGSATGKAMVSMNVAGLMMWGQFLAFLRENIEQAMAEDVWLGTIVSYAAGYELGFTDPSGGRHRRQYFFSGIRRAQRNNYRIPKSEAGGAVAAATEAELEAAEMAGGRGGSGSETVKLSRSGLYLGGRFAADIRSIFHGRVTARVARRFAGQEASRFFWGTLSNPEKNVLMVFAVSAKREIRRNIKAQGLVDTGALLNSIAIGKSEREMKKNSFWAVAETLGRSDQMELINSKVG